MISNFWTYAQYRFLISGYLFLLKYFILKFLFQSNHEIYFQFTGIFLISLYPTWFQNKAFRLAEAFCFKLPKMSFLTFPNFYQPSLFLGSLEILNLQCTFTSIENPVKYWISWTYYTQSEIIKICSRCWSNQQRIGSLQLLHRTINNYLSFIIHKICLNL